MGGFLEPSSWRLQRTETVPLYSSLGNREKREALSFFLKKLFLSSIIKDCALIFLGHDLDTGLFILF